MKVICLNCVQHQVMDPYKRFRYNFHYWLKNFKYNQDGTLQILTNGECVGKPGMINDQ